MNPQNQKLCCSNSASPNTVCNETIHSYYSYWREMEVFKIFQKYHPSWGLSFFLLSNFELNWRMREKREKKREDNCVSLPIRVNWLFIKFRPHLSIQRTVSKITRWPQITGNRLSLSPAKAIIYLVHISTRSERKHNTIRLSFDPWVIDVTPFEPCDYHITACKIRI